MMNKNKLKGHFGTPIKQNNTKFKKGRYSEACGTSMDNSLDKMDENPEKYEKDIDLILQEAFAAQSNTEIYSNSLTIDTSYPESDSWETEEYETDTENEEFENDGTKNHGEENGLSLEVMRCAVQENMDLDFDCPLLTSTKIGDSLQIREEISSIESNISSSPPKEIDEPVLSPVFPEEVSHEIFQHSPKEIDEPVLSPVFPEEVSHEIFQQSLQNIMKSCDFQSVLLQPEVNIPGRPEPSLQIKNIYDYPSFSLQPQVHVPETPKSSQKAGSREKLKRKLIDETLFLSAKDGEMKDTKSGAKKHSKEQTVKEKSCISLKGISPGKTLEGIEVCVPSKNDEICLENVNSERKRGKEQLADETSKLYTQSKKIMESKNGKDVRNDQDETKRKKALNYSTNTTERLKRIEYQLKLISVCPLSLQENPLTVKDKKNTIKETAKPPLQTFPSTESERSSPTIRMKQKKIMDELKQLTVCPLALTQTAITKHSVVAPPRKRTLGQRSKTFRSIR